MADEITYAGAGDMRVAALLNREVQELLYDPTDLRSTCKFVNFDAMGSTVLKTPQIDVDYAMAAPGETTAVANTAFVDASFSLTFARYALMFSPTDIYALTNPGPGSLDIPRIAQIIANTTGLTFTDLLCALFGALSQSVGGGAGIDLNVDYIYDAIYQLQATNNVGPYTCVLAANSWNEFQNSMRGETGANQFLPATAEMLAAKGPGFKGTWQGVEFYQSDSVVDAGATMDNAMYSMGAFAYTEVNPSKITPNIDRRIALQDSRCFVTLAWDDTQAEWRIVGNYYPAVSEAEDLRGVLISSDDA